jgi:hypothetical protein
MTDEEVYAAAEDMYGSDDVSIERDQPISRSSHGGAWVPAYVWVPYPAEEEP